VNVSRTTERISIGFANLSRASKTNPSIPASSRRITRVLFNFFFEVKRVMPHSGYGNLGLNLILFPQACGMSPEGLQSAEEGEFIRVVLETVFKKAHDQASD